MQASCIDGSTRFSAFCLSFAVITSPHGNNFKGITFVAHADTVFDKLSGSSAFSLSSDGTRAFGPGVIDDKGGLIVLVNGLRQYLKNQTATPHSLRVVISPSEELGSPGFLDTFSELAKSSWLVLGFEPALENGSIINSRRGNLWYHLRVQGREAHSGRSHADGVNACLELSKKIVQLSDLTDYSKGLTVSVGKIEGGKDKFNIVCGSAEAKLDIRFSTPEDQKFICSKLESILRTPTVRSHSDGTTSQTSFEIEDFAPAFAITVKGKEYLKQYLDYIHTIEGKGVAAEKSGGSADVNYFSQEDVIIIDGLGPIGGKMHTKEEYLFVPSLKTRALALSKFLNAI